MAVKFKGGRELEAALRQLSSQATRRNVAKRALDRAAEPIRDEWQRGVDVVTGTERRSIKIGERVQTKATRRFRRGAGQDVVERYVGIDLGNAPDPARLAIYSQIEEFGADNQPANPAGRRAWEQEKMTAFDRLADDLRDEIDKAARRAAKKAR